MSATLILILIALGFASVFLLIGLLLCSKIKLLQKLLLLMTKRLPIRLPPGSPMSVS